MLLRFIPESIHFGERGILQFTPLSFDCGFNVPETTVEFPIAASQRCFRIDTKEPGDVYRHKKQVADFIGNFLRVLLRMRLQKLGCFLL